MTESNRPPFGVAYPYSPGAALPIAMDMEAPYGVYLEGRCIAVYDDEESATRHFNHLRNPKASPGAREQQL